MTRFFVVPGLLVLVCSALPLSAEVLFSEDFDGPASLAERGWTVEAEMEQSEWSVQDGQLRAVCHRSPYKGGRIVREVPVAQRGVLEIEALFAQAGARNYDHLCLGVKLYGYMMAFKKLGGHQWMVYRPAENTWYTVTDRVPLGEWTHLRVEFDIPRQRVEYYLGDARDPLMIATELPMRPEGETGELEVFNYGVTKGTVTNLIDSITLRSIEEPADGAEASRDLALVFRGMTSDRYRAREALQETLGGERVVSYTPMTRRPATVPRNKLALDSVPGGPTWAQARWVVLEDMPAGPGEVLPPFLLEDLGRAVRGGAHLLVLAGPFSLGKGAWQGTALEEMLPVEIGGPWDLRRLDAPTPLSGCEGNPGVLWYHEAALTGGATPLPIAAATSPMVATHALGEGRVTVFLAAPLGDPAEFGEAEPFWEWGGWPDLLRSLAGVEGGAAQ
ncbi:MAG: hypothetical protein GF393_04320 [Armatimonadia bacterium]|nr:hypothetical protein [Armatimonadia bacterium]